MEKSFFEQIVRENISVKEALLQDDSLHKIIDYQVRFILHCLQNNGTIWFCGNGGSAADAQHLAAELSGRFYLDRPAYAAEALHVNTSFVTAVGNDFGFENVFSRAVEALAKPHDILILLSTSGNSSNILLAAEAARKKNVHVFAWTGETGGKLLPLADSIIRVQSNVTPRIQEAHMLIGHIICQYVEAEMEKWKK